MKALLHFGRFCLLVLVALFCAACGGDGGGGGAADPATGYSRADLAGNWAGYYTLQSGTVRHFTCTADADGRFTNWVFLPDGQPAPVEMKGQVTVYSHGQLNGVTSFLDGITPFKINWSHMFFTAPGKIKGTWVIDPPEDQPNVVMTKQ